LRSALQGKGYAKTVNIQNGGITTLIQQNTVKQDEELRRVLFTNDQVRDFKFNAISLYTFYFLLTSSSISMLKLN
jgi:hypothetical protein